MLPHVMKQNIEMLVQVCDDLVQQQEKLEREINELKQQLEKKPVRNTKKDLTTE